MFMLIRFSESLKAKCIAEGKGPDACLKDKLMLESNLDELIHKTTSKEETSD